jgi:hypothetical protein
MKKLVSVINTAVTFHYWLMSSYIATPHNIFTTIHPVTLFDFQKLPLRETEEPLLICTPLRESHSSIIRKIKRGIIWK